MPHIPTMAPGMLVQWWTDGSTEPVARLFTGEHGAREAKRFVVSLMEKTSSSIRVMAVVDVFQVSGSSQRMLPDTWAPVLDMFLREQAMGRGFQLQRRGPTKVHPADFMRGVQSKMESDAAMSTSDQGYTHPPAQGLLFDEPAPGPPQAPRNRGGEP